MPWNDPTEIPIGSDGQVYVADAGTALPAAYNSSLDPSDWKGLGFLSEDGFSTNIGKEVAEIMAWQSQEAVRREVTKRSLRFTLQLMQWNEDTIVTALGGGEVTSAGGGYKYVPPGPSDALAEIAVVIDAVDGDNVFRWCAPRVTVADDVESTWKRGEAALLPITLDALIPEDGGDVWQLLSNADGFATGS
jgi:hypothetical protein